MKYFSHLNSAANIIELYKGKEPFHYFIKQFFALEKKYGSKDRKNISHCCYCYFRIGKAFNHLPIKDRIVIGLFLCSTEPSEVLAALNPSYNERVQLGVDDKCAYMEVKADTLELFPCIDEVSDKIENSKFSLSHLVQPDLFLRTRPRYHNAVKKKLDVAGLSYKEINDSSLSLPNNSKVDIAIEMDREAVVQDYNSQQVGELMKKASHTTSIQNAWDCCAASGGKSIMAKDILGDIGLTVSDLRESIISNLKKRFGAAGIKNYQPFVFDVANAPLPSTIQSVKYDLIIADVPCSGSGTWGRTPEQLSYFACDKIEYYTNLQKKIVDKTIPQLNKGGCLLYITCSVFSKENEQVVDYIKSNHGLKVIEMQTLIGYDKKADTMFAALLQQN